MFLKEHLYNYIAGKINNGSLSPDVHWNIENAKIIPI